MKRYLISFLAATVIICLPAASSAILLGPYSGTVIDSQSGEPIEGASVLFYWEKAIPTPAGAVSELIGARLVCTDEKGSYKIPILTLNIGLVGFLESTNLIIYQPGYQAYIERKWNESPFSKPEHDPSFKPKDNRVKLDRIPPNFNYGEHYEKMERFLSGLHITPETYRISGKPLSWEKAAKLSLERGILEREEFLRRAEWEKEWQKREF